MSDYIGYGRNADLETDDFVRCARCGFWCQLSRDIHLPRGSRAGWGLTYVRQYTETTIESATVSDAIDSVSTAGRILTEVGETLFSEDGIAISIE